MTLAQMGASVLRNLGVNPIAQAEVYTDANKATPAFIADLALRRVGMPPPGGAAGTETVDSAFVADLALRRLNAMASDETAPAADASYAASEVQRLHMRWHRLNLVSWAANAIPTSYVQPYVLALAELMKPAFHGAEPNWQVVEAQELAMRRMTLGGEAGRNYAMSELRQIHGRWHAANIVTWTADNIPADTVEPYATALAEVLKAAFVGAVPDLAVFEAQEAIMRRLALSGSRGQALAEDRIRSAHAVLAGMGLAEYSLSATPRSMAESYIGMAAAELAPTYGAQMNLQAEAAAVQRARLMAMGRAPGTALALEAVQGVHADLAARGRTRWLLNDVPEHVAEPYAMLAAYRLAPRAGVAADPTWPAEAERMISRAIMLPSAGGAVALEWF